MKIFEWISKNLFGIPTKEEVPDACKNLFDKLEAEEKTIKMENAEDYMWVNPPEAYPQNLFLVPEKIGKEETKFDVVIPEKLTTEVAVKEYVPMPKEVELNYIKTTIDVEKGKVTNIKQKIVKSEKFEVQPRLGTFVDVETGKPLIRERPIKLNEEKADKVKKSRKPRNKRKSE